MKRFPVLLLAAASSCLLLATGDAQLYQPRPQVNPYTGNQAAPAANPLTGQGAQQRNPYTGRSMTPPANNPLTGKGGPQGQNDASAHPWPSDEVPVKGKAGKGLELIDKAVLKVMDNHGIPGASFALARNGKLIYAKGFGWGDLANKVPVEPQTPFGLASLSKPLTATATLLLVERGKLSLDDKVFDLLKNVHPPRGAKVDPRLKTITVRQLLNHTGGWDRSVNGDPVTWSPQISRAYRTPLPLTVRQFISFIQTVPLDFDPGTKFVYSNVGCILLDEIITQVSGEPWQTFVQKNVLTPAGMSGVFLGPPRTTYRKGEAHCYLAGTGTQLPPMNLPLARAAGGWNASAVDVVRFLTALDGSRGKKLLADKTFAEMVAEPPAPLKKNKNGTYPGLGWPLVGPSGKKYAYAHDGNWYGMRTFMKCNPSKGLNWALLFNVTMQPDPTDQGIVTDLARELKELLDGTESFPDLDLRCNPTRPTRV
jgi:N-acyl-D-amino-acid deacylase